MQSIIAIIVAVWFFRSARAVGKNGISWAIAGVLAFLAPSLPWLLFIRSIIPRLAESDLGDTPDWLVGFALGLVGIGLGLLAAFWLYKAKLRPVAQKKTDSHYVNDKLSK
ncbi:MAG: hypothetical protein M3A44_15040 [Gammaproteobacteria bacterium]